MAKKILRGFESLVGRGVRGIGRGAKKVGSKFGKLFSKGKSKSP